MQERGLSVDEVSQVVNEPDGKISQSRDKFIFFKRLVHRRDNLIAAVLVEILPDEEAEIITVLINFEVRK